MKKFFVFMAALALMTQGADAKSITIDQAKAIAKQQFAQTAKFNASNAKMTLSYTAMNMKGVNDYYVFNREGGQGFVIVAGDDMSTPILGYSNMGSFDMSTAPEALQAMLKEYQARMDWLRHNPEAAAAPRFTYNLQPYGVTPICGDVHWHQFPPYNNYAPRSSKALTSNGRCYAGCVPVAFSTIMKGLRYPSRGCGEFSYDYVLDGQPMTATAKFDDWSYNYSNMRNGYGETASNARDVSELVYEVGVAFHTIYSGESSDALLKNVFRGIIAFFNFNANIQYVQKSSYQYNDSVWYEMMYNEIDNGRPIYYMGYRTIDNSGNSCNVGHAYVLDGYDRNGKVHVNWGFQPEEYNTYFDWELLSPRNNYDYDPYASGFNANQAAIIGLCPDTTGIGGVVVKNVNLVAETMPANDLRATIDVQSLGGVWNGTLKYGIVSKNSDGTYSAVLTKTASNVEIEDNGTVNLDLSGNYANYYLTQGKTYYVVVYTPYFVHSTESNWMWFLDDPVPFTIGDWENPPLEVTETPAITWETNDEAQEVTITVTGNGEIVLYNNDVEVARGESPLTYTVAYTDNPEGEEMTFSATAQEDGKDVSEPAQVTIEVPGKPLVYTDKPVITWTVDEEAQTVTVTATGNGTVILYNDDIEVARGEGVATYVIPFTEDPEGEEMGFSATAQEEGKEVSEYALATVEIPGKPEPQFILGDVDGDGKVSIGDVTALIDLMLREGDYTEAADMDGDGKVSIGDVTALIDFLLKDEVEE